MNKNNITTIPISQEMESSFLDYAMSVIVSRAIPDARDGMKPVHRRILFSMETLEMYHNKAFKKSARVIGELIAKFHPHGDAAGYESLVRMAQPFSLRYPLVWGQGNFGSIDGDSAAAMRYTEAKLTKIASLMLEDIKKNTVDFQENYDGSEIEPKVLPGKIPNLLLNGSTGIAVGMATSIPPHNITETFNAAIALAKNPDMQIPELMEFIKGPDFPTAGIIINKDELLNAYSTGRGRVITRGRAEIEFNEDNNKSKIIITEIPYMLNKSNLILKIVELAKNKSIESISDIKDESNRDGIRISIKLKRGYIPEVELNKLYKMSPLQSSFAINLLALVNNRPVLLNLKTALEVYNNHQIDVLVRKTKYLLKKATQRKHILEGLDIALKNINKIIKLIKESKNNSVAIATLRKEFNLSEIQAKSILDMKLQRLTGLEIKNLAIEIEKLAKEIKQHQELLLSKDKQIDSIVIMMREILEKFGDDRITAISEDSIFDINNEDLIPKEEVAIIFSNTGYIKRIPIKNYRIQGRGGKGSRSATTNKNDYIKHFEVANTHTDIIFITSLGRAFKLRAHQIPDLSKTAKGIPIINLIDLKKDEKVINLVSVDNYECIDFFFVTKKGIVKKTFGKEFKRVNKNGKKAITLKDRDELIGMFVINSEQNNQILIGNKSGKAIRFNSDDIRFSGRTASGVKGMNIDGGEVVGYAFGTEKSLILSVSELGFGKLTPLSDYRLTKRAGKGVMSLNTQKAGNLVCLHAVKGDEDLIVASDKGTVLRTNLSFISQVSRNTKGVRIIRPKDGEIIASVAAVESEEELTKEIQSVAKNKTKQ